MKTFKTIQEFSTAKNISKEINEQVLSYINKLINKDELKQLKIEWLYSKRNVTKFEKIIENLTKLGMNEIPIELSNKLKEETKRKEELEQIFKK